MKKINVREKYKILDKILKNMEKDHISEYSSQCSYYTILSFIPFVILLITLIQYTGINQETLFNAISKIVPSGMDEMVISIVQEVYSKSLGTISISIIFTLWSAGKGLYALTKGLHTIYKTNEEESTNYFYLRLRVLGETILFIFLIALGLIGMVFGGNLLLVIQNKFGIFENFDFLSVIFTKVIFLLATIAIFAIIYRFMPKHKVKLKSQIYGAVFGAIALNIVSLVFSKYLDIFKGFSITYGSLTTLMLILMWTYACFYTVFLGAEINKIVQIQKNKESKKKRIIEN